MTSKKTDKNLDFEMDRRRALKRLGHGAAGLLGLTSVPLSFSYAPRASAATQPENLFVFVIAGGGMDSNVGITAPVGARASSDYIDAQYRSFEKRQVPGKDKLIVGPGLFSAIDVFKNHPTAFILGQPVEIPAHEFAFSAFIGARRSRQTSVGLAGPWFSYLAMMNPDKKANFLTMAPGFFPAFDPDYPIYSSAAGGVHNLFGNPEASLGFDQARTARRDSLTAGLNLLRQKSVASDVLLPAYEKANETERFVRKLDFSERLRVDDAALAADPIAKIFVDPSEATKTWAATYLTLRAGLVSCISFATGYGFDVHTDPNAIGDSVTMVDDLGRNLAKFVSALDATPDPLVPGQPLSKRVTIIISSEFGRSAKRTPFSGTEHAATRSDILIGNLVRDNTVLGGLNIADGVRMLDFETGNFTASETNISEPFSELNALYPEVWVAMLFKKLGQDALAKKLTKATVNEKLLFT